ncbi:hypothetical protein LINGRAPRIM_LOCUS852 [Linum grandiflorum]
MVAEVDMGTKGYVVDVRKHTCSCGYWELAGIPCLHAIAAEAHFRKQIYYWTAKCYSITRACQAYGYGGIPSLPGQ